MARTGPDFGKSAPQESITVVSDMGELAARLGSVVLFNRSGTVFFIDDFEGTVVHWHESGSGSIHTLEISTESAYTGSKSCKMSTSSGTGDNVRMYRLFYYPIKQKIGIAFSFQPENAPKYMILRVIAEDGTNEYRGQIRIDMEDGILEYRDSDGNYQTFATNIDWYQDMWYYHYAKLIIDLDSGKYHKFIFDSTEYDLSEFDMQETTEINEVSMEVWLQLVSLGDDDSICYIDNVILTQNEI